MAEPTRQDPLSALRAAVAARVQANDLAGAIRLLRDAAADDATPEIYHVLGRLLRASNEHDEALNVYQQCLAAHPGDDVSSFALAALGATASPERVPPAIIMAVFDDNAEIYDQNLASVGYQTPNILAAAAVEILDPAPASLDMLDVGCGTGLCGPLFRPFARQLDGVDLSPKMLERARVRATYDLLAAVDISTEALGASSSYDLVFGADVMMYVGKLDEVLGRVYDVLRDGGHFLFNVEKGGPDDYSLGTTGRYVHAPGYVESQLVQARFGQPLVRESVIRTENNNPVSGLVFVAQKLSAGNV